jgi:hypothetical protein
MRRGAVSKFKVIGKCDWRGPCRLLRTFPANHLGSAFVCWSRSQNLGVVAFAMSSMALAQPSNGVHETKKRLVESLNGKMPKHVMITPTQKRVLILGLMLPSTADCWKKFSWIADKESNKLVMVKNDRNDHVFFTACNDCKDVYAYSKGNGTSSLVNHKCSLKMAQPRLRAVSCTSLSTVRPARIKRKKC